MSPRSAPHPRRRRTRRRGGLSVGLLLLVLCAGWAAHPTSAEDPGWAQAVGPREWSFPRDHGAHPAYRTEWWYFTGNLRDAGGRRYGYQLTFFRQGVRWEPTHPENPWSLRDAYLAHFAVTEEEPPRFRHAERLNRAGPGLAGALEGRMDVWNLDWTAVMKGETIRLRARTAEMGLDLALVPRKPVVLHGEGGLSRKGPAPGQASYYASFTDLATEGHLVLGAGAEPLFVRGSSWFDQEFGSNQLSEEQAGWDWFSLHLSDGRDLMVYLLRRRDGTIEPASSGTLVERDGSSRSLPLAEITVEVRERWTSPRSGARYPSRWRLVAPGVELVFGALIPDQELDTSGSTGVVYWEGAVWGEGTSGGRPVTCEGYVELTGYAGDLGGLF
ncbi:MAG: lipocalin-like domain-containing protein [Deferrisomatales bacterium]